MRFGHRSSTGTWVTILGVIAFAVVSAAIGSARVGSGSLRGPVWASSSGSEELRVDAIMPVGPRVVADARSQTRRVLPASPALWILVVWACLIWPAPTSRPPDHVRTVRLISSPNRAPPALLRQI